MTGTNFTPNPVGTVPSAARRLGNVITLLLCGLLSGVVLAAGAFPMMGMMGLTTKTASDSFQNLPADLTAPTIPQTTRLFDKDGNYVTSFYEENRTVVEMDSIPQVMQDAMVAGEDARFYEHNGADPVGMLRAFIANRQSGEIQQGASTITQQYVKNVLKYSAETEEEREAAEAPTAARKIREVRFAIAVEKRLSKKEILNNYLNIAFFGNNAYGVAAAAKAYFSKDVSDLTLAESALLAGLVQSPSTYNPAKNDGKQATDRRNYVLDRMVDLEMISESEAEVAKDEEIVLNQSIEPRQCENAPDKQYGFYCAYFLEWWQEQSEFGQTRAERVRTLERGGFDITLGYDADASAKAQAAVDKQTSRNNRFMVGIVMVEPGTGRVLGMANNRTYSIEENPGGRKYPNTVIPLMTGTNQSAGYQAGSTFKMFTAVAALEQGMPLDYDIYSPYKYKSKQFRSGSAGASCPIGGGKFAYCPANHSKSVKGTYNMWSAFAWSVNTYFVQLAERTGVPAAIDAAEKLGARMRDSRNQQYLQEARDNPAQGGAFTLGVTSVTPLDMASAYATLAARGRYCEPSPLRSITSANGEPLPYANPKCQQVIPPDVADAANDMARCPVGQESMLGGGKCGGNRTASSVGRTVKRPVAGKTGTTDSNASAWFVGYTPNLAAAVVKVNPDRPSEGMSGNQTLQPIKVFQETMAAVLPRFEHKDFVKPTKGRVTGSTQRIPTVDGMDPDRARSTLERAGFSVHVDPDEVDSPQRKGRVARTLPEGGQKAPEGSSITIYVSNGNQSD